MQYISVVEYNSAWREKFEREAGLFKNILKDELVAVHHIGSTAVPGLKAKPVIDIMPVVKDIARVDGFRAQFESAGYEYLGEFGIAGRRFLRKGGAHRTHNVHIFGVSSRYEIARHLAVRDYLHARPAEAAAYGELKARLALQFPEDIDGYCDGKDAFVKELEKKALAFVGFSSDSLDKRGI